MSEVEILEQALERVGESPLIAWESMREDPNVAWWAIEVAARGLMDAMQDWWQALVDAMAEIRLQMEALGLLLATSKPEPREYDRRPPARLIRSSQSVWQWHWSPMYGRR